MTRVTMQFVNEWRYKTIFLDRKTIISQLYGFYVYYTLYVFTTGVSDFCAMVRVCLGAVMTLLTHIHDLLAKLNIATTLIGVSTVFWLLIPLQDSWLLEKAVPRSTFSNERS